MTSKRILLVIDDKLLLKLYQEKIEENGFAVFAARDMGKAAQLLVEKKPDLLLLDVVFQEGNPMEFIQAIRAEAENAQLPILILPNLLGQVANEATQAGATRAILPGASPIASVIDAIRSSLGMPGLGASADKQLFKPDEFWVDAIFANAVDSINRMRHCLPGIAEMPPELPALHELWNLAHAFAQKTALLPYKPFAQIAGSFDMLLHGLNETPDQLNPSTIRTVGQALDFLASISKPECLARLTDPAAASLLVVDDEDGARQFITSALQLAGLKNECAESPASAIEKLNKSPMNLIFLDVGLPEMNGFELCTKVRAIEQYKTTPIVFLTGMATFQNKAKASLSGGNDFVGKPFNLPELGVKALMWLCRGQLAMV
jgi:DNA-binding response OmpR family regulator